MKVRPEAGVVPVPLFSKLRSPEDTGADSEPKDTFFSTDELQKLETRGFIVKDGFSSADLTLLREEVTAMKTGGTLKSANMSSSVAETWNDPKTRGDLHHWLNEDKERINSEYPQLGALLQAMDNLRVELNERCDFNSSKTQVRPMSSQIWKERPGGRDFEIQLTPCLFSDPNRPLPRPRRSLCSTLGQHSQRTRSPPDMFVLLERELETRERRLPPSLPQKRRRFCSKRRRRDV